MAYTRVNWSDAPDTSTPISADNLNQMDAGIASLDAEKQDTLVSGTNIKTINNTSLLGDGNINVGVAPTDLLNYIYPVGSVYMSTNSISPETFLGGTWVQIKDQFLLSAGDTYIAGTTGGSANHTLTIDEMPSHTHIQNAHRHLTYKNWGVKIGTGATNYLTGTSSDGFSGSGNYTDNATATNQNTGGDQPFSIMPPYLAVYMWERTA